MMVQHKTITAMKAADYYRSQNSLNTIQVARKFGITQGYLTSASRCIDMADKKTVKELRAGKLNVMSTYKRIKLKQPKPVKVVKIEKTNIDVGYELAVKMAV